MSRTVVHFVLVLTCLFTRAAQAADCEPSHETRIALRRLEINDLTDQELRAKQMAILEELLAQHPDDVFLHLRYQQMAGYETNAPRSAVIVRYKDLAERHSENNEFLFLYASALVDTDTPKAITLFKQILSSERGYPLAHLELALAYAWGKFADHPGARAELDSFYVACPASLYRLARGLLKTYATSEMAAKYSVQFRERLKKETDPDLLAAWETVWNLEFKANSPNRHDHVRKQIAADLERLQHGPPPKDVQWLWLLHAGYEMLGDDAAQKRIEDRLQSEYPDTFQAKNVFRERWRKEHPYPKGEDSEGSQVYYRAQLEMSEKRLKRSPADFEYISGRFEALSGLDTATAAQIEQAGEALREGVRRNPGWWATPPYEFQIAKVYVRKKIRLEEVPTLVDEGRRTYRDSQSRETSDRQPDEWRKNIEETDRFVKTEAARILLEAAEQLKKPEIAKGAMEALTDTRPERASDKSALWAVKGKWAELNSHKLDALLMYRAALAVRPGDYKPKGKDKDELAEGFDRLWKELGGTAESKDLWAAAAKNVETVSDERWEKPKKEMPAWELADLEGKTWKAVSLKGKTLLINVWATWCGPCRAEHPVLEKLYEKIKGRPDVEILTFNIDDEIGIVAPYMKENKYMFPVLLAKDLVTELLPSIGIPQNWIVDRDGVWRWEEIGFGTADTWEKSVLEKLEAKPQ